MKPDKRIEFTPFRLPDTDTLRRPFLTIKGRYVVAVWLLPLFYLPGADTFFRTVGEEWPWYWRDVFYYYYGHLLLVVTALTLAVCGKLSWASLFGRKEVLGEIVPGLKLTLFIFLFSIATAYLLFLPLSYVAPDFVEWWYIYASEIIYSDGYSYPFAANVFGFISLVIIAPIIEEIAFRGLLLHRWAQKWGLIKAVLFSSLLFGIAHPDPVGAIAFGIGMCILYLRTQSLFVPVICHAANNLGVWLIEAGYRFFEGPGHVYTLEVFRNEWYIGFVCGILSIVWIFTYFRKQTNYREWRLPVI